MTSVEMVAEVKRLLDKEDSPHLENTAIVTELNRSTEEFVTRKHAQFELNEATLDDLRTLVVDETTLTLTAGHYVFPADYQHKLRVNADTTDVRCTKSHTGVGCRFIQQDDWNEAISDPFEKGHARIPIYTVNVSGIKMNVGTVDTIGAVRLSYLKRYTTIVYNSVNSDLPVHTHPDIVNIAVRSLLEELEQPRLTSFQNEQIIQESN